MTKTSVECPPAGKADIKQPSETPSRMSPRFIQARTVAGTSRLRVILLGKKKAPKSLNLGAYWWTECEQIGTTS